MKGYIKPCWNMEEFYDLSYNLAPFYNNDQINEYIKSGHKKDSMFIEKYHEPNPMPSCIKEKIFPYFTDWKNITAAVNLFKPGKYLPYHGDSYFRYREVFNITKETIVRAVVMLEDWQPGQIILVGDKSYSGWKSGEYWYWENDTKHSFYNMSLVNRYALQITGTKY